MNILELIIRSHPQVEVQTFDSPTGQWLPHASPALLISKRKLDGKDAAGTLTGTLRGLHLKSGERVVVRRASAYWPDFSAGRGGFFPVSNNFFFPARLKLGWRSSEGQITGADLEVGVDGAKVAVPAAPEGDADLVIEVPRQKGNKLFLGVHWLLDRAYLYRQCVGNGVEIGPGPRPQVLPSATTTVRYVEQATPEQWESLYGKDSRTPLDKALWQHYVVGNADAVPAAPGTLDFIFSSHVVEHLGNPLGHFAYWATLLKPGGKVLAVIPDRSGCKDFVFPPSTLEELEAELAAGDMRVALHHYQRWLPHRMPKADAQQLLESGRSIHAHFYTAASMEAVLGATATRLGFGRFEVTASANHKDFFVTLVK